LLDHVQETKYIGPVKAFHVLSRGLFNGTHQADAGVVHDNIDPAEPCLSGLDRFDRLTFITHIQHGGQ
jgi:hypothetical protein